MYFKCDTCNNDVPVTNIVVRCLECEENSYDIEENSCEHELISIKNEKIDSGFMCVKCSKLYREYVGE